MIDYLQTLTRTDWFVSVFVLTSLACLVATYQIKRSWQKADAELYRTADAGLMRLQANELLQDAHISRTTDLHQHATAAALKDLHRKPGQSGTANPHPPGTMAYSAWARTAGTVYAQGKRTSKI